MKVVILGGGIAGLCMGIYLHQNNIEVSVNERQVFAAVGGHAFLMHHDGIAVLKELIGEQDCVMPGRVVDTFIFRDPGGQVVTEQHLADWHCFKRTDLLECLRGLIPAEKLVDNRIFSHFLYEGPKVIAAVFRNGDIEYGDLFIGADGANSVVRRAVLGEVAFMTGKVKEVVGIARHQQLAESFKGRFIKFQHPAKGLSFGMIPTSEAEVVWFMQYDPSAGDVPEDAEQRHSEAYPEMIRELCLNNLTDFPAEVQEILKQNDFTTSYIWNTRDFDLLPAFHSNNVVLIGDAAHVALPFTSAGTTNAMVDAKVLTESLLNNSDSQSAFKEYYRIRSVAVAHHIKLGRELRDAFLNPSAMFALPLITAQVND
jgi:FAD-dependent urate hydroxylase